MFHEKNAFSVDHGGGVSIYVYIYIHTYTHTLNPICVYSGKDLIGLNEGALGFTTCAALGWPYFMSECSLRA